MGAIVIRTRYDEGTESAEVATSGVDNNFTTPDIVCNIKNSRLRRLDDYQRRMLLSIHTTP
jgi:hypothetical protein